VQPPHRCAVQRGVYVLRNFRLAALLLTAIALGGCVGVRQESEYRGFHKVDNVPFFPQKSYQCGPASLAGVLNYWGIKVSPGQIAEAIYSKSAQGTLDQDMVFYVRNKGLAAEQYSSTIGDIEKKIDAGKPLIVLVDYGFWVYQKNHFMVVVGYNDQAMLVNSGSLRNKPIPVDTFMKIWDKTNRWTLLISP
jgi:ABC-type bacteriocin/lantibiotic exporter with double-glycine peptidase domain